MPDTVKQYFPIQPPNAILIVLYFYFKKVYCIMDSSKGGDDLKKSVKIILIALCYIFLCVFMFSGYKIFTIMREYKEAENMYSDLSNQFVSAQATPAPTKKPDSSADPQATEPPVEPTPDPNVSPISVDFNKLLETNGDVRGWLLNPDTIINYPFVQGVDNDYYLYRFLDGSSNSSGTLFVDYRCAGDFSSNHTIIYGHNMRDGSMFGNLKMIVQDPTVCQVNRYFYIYTEDCVYTYEVFSCYRVDSSSDRYMTFTSDENYDLYTEWAVENSVMESDADLSQRGNIVSLSTCHGTAGTSRRLIVHGVLVLTEEYTIK